MKVEAWVVTVKNGAAAENVGLLQPLLRRFQAGKVSMMVFGLPAVMVRCPVAARRNISPSAVQVKTRPSEV